MPFYLEWDSLRMIMPDYFEGSVLTELSVAEVLSHGLALALTALGEGAVSSWDPSPCALYALGGS